MSARVKRWRENRCIRASRLIAVSADAAFDTENQLTELELRGLLGCFLFSGDDADKKIRILSGGEKARVALAKVIVSKANFLMLDEPTNHLDMHSCDLLIESLNRYQGSIILVSHDRYFVAKTANKIWEIVDHQIKEFKGGYEEWVAWKERMAKLELENKKSEKQAEPAKPVEVKQKQATPPPAPAPKQQPGVAIDKEKKKELLLLPKTKWIFQKGFGTNHLQGKLSMLMSWNAIYG